MNYNKSLILTWILFSCILIIENVVIPMQAYVFVRLTKSWMLWLTCIWVWVMLWYWIRWSMIKKNFDDDEENFNF